MSARYEGVHLIADLHGAQRLDDADHIATLLRCGAQAAGATVLEVSVHHFGPGHGVTGVAILAESHMSIHSWPEHGYAAIDIFVCGARNDAQAALDVVAQGLGAERVETQQIARGYAALNPDYESASAIKARVFSTP